MPEKVFRNDLVCEARKYIGARFGHQGRTARILDCGGLILVTARALGLSELEYLGYASFPSNGKFEQLLSEHAIDTGDLFTFPFRFSGKELLPGDLLSFDYGNGEGVRHIALVTRFTGRRYDIIEATPKYGVSEHPLAFPFIENRTTLRRYRVKGLIDG